MVQLDVDRRLLFSVLLLFGIGLVQVYSASFIFALESYDDSLFFFRRQMIFVGLGTLVVLVCSQIPWSFFRRTGFWGWVAIGALVAVTLIPGVGVKVGGAQRWIQLPMGFRLEPVELLKVLLPFAFVQFCVWDQVLWKRLMALTLIVTPIGLLLMQPDFGSLVILSTILFMLFFVFGKYLKWLTAAVIAAIPAFYFLVMTVPYRRARVLAFLDPWADPAQKGFQTIQSLLGFHSGGITGVGLGQGQAKLMFLPEAHTDFTLSVWGEEMGFIGFVFLLALYGYVVFRGFEISWRAQEFDTKAVSLGITLMFGLSIFINMGVVLGILPAKGLTLPFLSYGGSSLLSMAFAVGILLSAERAIRQYRPSKPNWQQFTFRGTHR